MSIYINSAAFEDLLDDICAELNAREIDLVASFDAMGFVLGAVLGARLGKGFLPIRTSDKLCVDTGKVGYGHYSGRTQDMERRTPAFAEGTRVLRVDQWVETGGRLDGAVRLVECKGGAVAGMVAGAMEENEATDADRATYKIVKAVQQNAPWQTACTFPTVGRTKEPAPVCA